MASKKDTPDGGLSSWLAQVAEAFHVTSGLFERIAAGETLAPDDARGYAKLSKDFESQARQLLIGLTRRTDAVH